MAFIAQHLFFLSFFLFSKYLFMYSFFSRVSSVLLRFFICFPFPFPFPFHSLFLFLFSPIFSKKKFRPPFSYKYPFVGSDFSYLLGVVVLVPKLDGDQLMDQDRLRAVFRNCQEWNYVGQCGESVA
jgi:hypothetical protein